MKAYHNILIASSIAVFWAGCAYYTHSGGKVAMVTNEGARVCIASTDSVSVNDELNVYRTVRESYSSKAQTTRSGHTRLKTGKVRVIEILDAQHFCAKLTEGTVEEGYTVDK